MIFLTASTLRSASPSSTVHTYRRRLARMKSWAYSKPIMSTDVRVAVLLVLKENRGLLIVKAKAQVNLLLICCQTSYWNLRPLLRTLAVAISRCELRRPFQEPFSDHSPAKLFLFPGARSLDNAPCLKQLQLFFRPPIFLTAQRVLSRSRFEAFVLQYSLDWFLYQTRKNDAGKGE